MAGESKTVHCLIGLVPPISVDACSIQCSSTVRCGAFYPLHVCARACVCVLGEREVALLDWPYPSGIR